MGLLRSIAVVTDLASRRHTQPPVFTPPGGSSGGDGLSAMAPALLFFGGVLLVALIAYLAYAMQRARRQGFQQVAMQLGLSYSQQDPLDLLRYPFTLFSKGDSRKLENVISGAWQEVDVIAFDYRYT